MSDQTKRVRLSESERDQFLRETTKKVDNWPDWKKLDSVFFQDSSQQNQKPSVPKAFRNGHRRG